MPQNRKPKGSQDGGQYDAGGFDRADVSLSDLLDAWCATTPPTQTAETPAWTNVGAVESGDKMHTQWTDPDSNERAEMVGTVAQISDMSSPRAGQRRFYTEEGLYADEHMLHKVIVAKQPTGPQDAKPGRPLRRSGR